MKRFMICVAALFLISCGSGSTTIGSGDTDSGDTDTTDAGDRDTDDNEPDDTGTGNTETGDSVAGRALFESAELSCVNCHGIDAQSPTPIDLLADTISRGSEEYTLPAYIEMFMPQFDPTLCDAECATNIAAYLRTLAEELPDPTLAPSELFSVVTRLTNDEYYAVPVSYTHLTLPTKA